MYKSNWQELEKILYENNVSSLFHITDECNLESIFYHGYLYSLYLSFKNKIEICKPGGNKISRNYDFKKNIANYVRLSFSTDNPMITAAIKDGRITSPYVLEFSTKIIFDKNTLFCPINATDHTVEKIDDSTNLFKKIRFDIINNDSMKLNHSLQKFKQAEILVKEKLSLEFLITAPYPLSI